MLRVRDDIHGAPATASGPAGPFGRARLSGLAGRLGLALLVIAAGDRQATHGDEPADVEAGGSGGSSAQGGGAAAATTPAGPATPPAAGGSGSAGVTSADQAYDPDLGGLFQIVATGIGADGTVTLKWVAAPDSGGESPTTREEVSIGTVKVWLVDTRPHADVTAAVTSATSPVKKLSWVFPPDDALVVVRLTLRETGTEPSLGMEMATDGHGAGTIVVTVDD